MNDILAISLSGLRASAASFGAAASNIANVNDVSSIPLCSPLEPVQNQSGHAYQAIIAFQQNAGANGVTVSYAAKVPSYSTAYDPSSLYANDKGMVAVPNVNFAEEMVKIAMAVQAFRANMAVIKTADQMTKSALDILS